MIICVINDTKKIRMFSVKARSFVHLDGPYDLSRVAITPSQAFC